MTLQYFVTIRHFILPKYDFWYNIITKFLGAEKIIIDNKREYIIR